MLEECQKWREKMVEAAAEASEELNGKIFEAARLN